MGPTPCADWVRVSRRSDSPAESMLRQRGAASEGSSDKSAAARDGQVSRVEHTGQRADDPREGSPDARPWGQRPHPAHRHRVTTRSEVERSPSSDLAASVDECAGALLDGWAEQRPEIVHTIGTVATMAAIKAADDADGPRSRRPSSRAGRASWRNSCSIN
jgi:hypothetical protein